MQTSVKADPIRVRCWMRWNSWSIMNRMGASGQSVPVLWTGGWDSTFRVCQLALIERRPVQPHYFLLPRPSTGVEIQTIRRLKRMIGELDADARRIIRPTIYTDFEDADRAGEAPYAAAVQRFKEVAHFGGQYSKLAFLAAQRDLRAVELSIHHDDFATRMIADHLEQGADGRWSLRADAPPDVKLLFERFTFPLIDQTKVAMQEISRANGFEPILQETWFCHLPKGREPCGGCRPCLYARAEGMAWRVPLQNRVTADVKWWLGRFRRAPKKLVEIMATPRGSRRLPSFRRLP